MSIAESLERLRGEIEEACACAGRSVGEITLIAVSKTQPASALAEAYDAGIRHCGENRVQEILAKRPALLDLALTWHMIGHLQGNKARAVRPHLGVLHTLDSPELARRLNEIAPAGPPLATLIQVNTSGEASKSGVAPDGLDPLVDAVRASEGLTLQGLMTIGPYPATESEIRHSFALLRELRDGLRSRHKDLPLPALSMGMSDDFRLAIAEGATHLRIGGRIFGPRSA